MGGGGGGDQGGGRSGGSGSAAVAAVCTSNDVADGHRDFSDVALLDLPIHLSSFENGFMVSSVQGIFANVVSEVKSWFWSQDWDFHLLYFKSWRGLF